MVCPLPACLCFLSFQSINCRSSYSCHVALFRHDHGAVQRRHSHDAWSVRSQLASAFSPSNPSIVDPHVLVMLPCFVTITALFKGGIRMMHGLSAPSLPLLSLLPIHQL